MFHIHLDKAAKARRLCTRLMRSSRRAGGGRNRRRMFVICAWIFPRCRISMAAPGGRGQGERHTAELGQCNIAYNWRYYFCAFKKFTVLGGEVNHSQSPFQPPLGQSTNPHHLRQHRKASHRFLLPPGYPGTPPEERFVGGGGIGEGQTLACQPWTGGGGTP